ncbi:hypothetical protein HOY82DRAFT_596262 [Tuber indicum]|nr:hypothetical protein HOY82DRAFT_596262 [Tuber indicum]
MGHTKDPQLHSTFETVALQSGKKLELVRCITVSHVERLLPNAQYANAGIEPEDVIVGLQDAIETGSDEERDRNGEETGLEINQQVEPTADYIRSSMEVNARIDCGESIEDCHQEGDEDDFTFAKVMEVRGKDSWYGGKGIFEDGF